MPIPVIRGVIARRILVNYRVDPAVLARLLPAPFRPQLVGGAGIAGVCMIRLEAIRPRPLPAWMGLASENAAHRIAVVWDTPAGPRTGVYIPRRDTNSPLNLLLGGRVFPGVHHHARFAVAEAGDRFRVGLDSDDGATHLRVEGRVGTALPATSAFGSLAAASAFFEQGALGYSATGDPGRFDGLELRSFGWRVEPLDVTVVESSFFADRDLFPAGSVEFDCALLMRGIAHEWYNRGTLCAPVEVAEAVAVAA